MLHVGLVQAQVDGMAVEDHVAGFGVQRFDQGLRIGDHGLGAGHAEDVATVGDFHAEFEFHLAEMFVERAGHVGQALVVFRGEGEVALCECGHCVRRPPVQPTGPQAGKGRTG